MNTQRNKTFLVDDTYWDRGSYAPYLLQLPKYLLHEPFLAG